jgi:nucleoid-associated protein YgaU
VSAAPSTARSTPSTPSAPPGVSIDWPGPAARGHSAADHSVVVLRGDSLWAIAARSLPDGADDATVDRTWRDWYAANTSVIGNDPNQLLPGQILQPPTANPGTGTHS